MDPAVRTLLDPEYETTISVRVAPLELSGGPSRRLVAWIFEGPTGDFICSLPVHKSLDLQSLSDPELEEAYLLALALP